MSLSFGGEAKQADDIFDLSLEELMDYNVDVASYRNESVTDTPAVVSKYYRSELEGMGIDSVADFLSFVPGINVSESAIGTQAIMARGLVEPFNQKILFMLNGVPYWQPAHGDNALSGISFHSISHIEIIRGPGAVLYGTNASAGVINIVTRNDEEDEVEFTLGNQGYKQAAIYLANDRGSEVRWELSAHWQDENAVDVQFTNRPVPGFFPAGLTPNGSISKFKSAKSIQLGVQYADFNFMLHSFNSSAKGLAGPAAITNESELQYESTLFHLDYAHSVGKLSFNTYLDVNQFDLVIPTRNLFGGREDGTQFFDDKGDGNVRYNLGVNGNVALADEANIQFGLQTELRKTANYINRDGAGVSRAVTMESDSVTENSIYSQLDYQWEALRLLGGFRYVDIERAGTKLLPRLSAVYTLAADSSIKLLYATGFNSPNLIQQGINIPPNVVSGNPNLKPEQVTSYEIAYSYNRSANMFTLSAYYIEAEDFIQRVINPSGGVIYQNAENIDRRGVELDWNYRKDRVNVFVNANYLPEGHEENASDKTAFFVPKLSMNFGASYRVSESHSFGVSTQYRSEAGAAQAVMYVNAVYSFEYMQHELSFNVGNILSEDIEYADIQDFNHLRVIGGEASKQNVKLSYRFHF